MYCLSRYNTFVTDAYNIHDINVSKTNELSTKVVSYKMLGAWLFAVTYHMFAGYAVPSVSKVYF